MEWPCRWPPSPAGMATSERTTGALPQSPDPNWVTTPRGAAGLSQVFNSPHQWAELRKVWLAWKVNQVFLNAYNFCSFLILEGKPVSLTQCSKSFKIRYNMVWSPTHTHQDHGILLTKKGLFLLYIWDQQNMECWILDLSSRILKWWNYNTTFLQFWYVYHK